MFALDDLLVESSHGIGANEVADNGTSDRSQPFTRFDHCGGVRGGCGLVEWVPIEVDEVVEDP